MASAPRELPAQLPAPLADALASAARTVAELSAARGVARIDFLSNGTDAFFVNEVNTVPGSLARYLWVDPPVPFSGAARVARRRGTAATRRAP